MIYENRRILEKHKGTFTVREHKKASTRFSSSGIDAFSGSYYEMVQFSFLLKQKPAMLDWFGWCTWDAFYFDVNPRGIMDGLKRYLFLVPQLLF